MVPLQSVCRFLRPGPRSFGLDLGLALVLLCLWLALSGFEPLVAAATDQLRLAVRAGSYRPQLPLFPAAVAAAGLVLAWLRHRCGGSPQLQERLQRATLLTAALLALRLLALWDAPVYLFPFLTLLWSPHALWAVALIFLGYVHLPPAGCRGAFPIRCAAAGLLILFLPLYLLYALYFCQITMLHGDESHYLRVTQSLLHDGDMDLANNLEEGYTDEFHVTEFAVHKAPASPEGKVHSVHPIGLSVALVPAYWWGLERWENPRLAAALLMALWASLCVPLFFLYLTRLGAEPWAALLATAVMALTGPFFNYTNQLYPEVPALLIVLVALVPLAHWQLPGGSYRSWGRWEVKRLGSLTLLLGCLPFLHPRYVPLALLCGAVVLLQAWHGPRRRLALAVVGLAAAAALWAHLAFNFAFSGDWMGPFRPGNAWDEGALDLSTWGISLPGHWLQASKGILNNSPIYFIAFLGLLALARRGDRRALVAAGIYAATAAVNGLHPIWEFGFGLPARFLVTALPVLGLGLAWGLPLLLRSAATAFLAALALAVSMEGVFDTVRLTENSFKDHSLLARSINHFYPLHQHFFAPGRDDIPLLDMAFWGLLTASLFLRPRHPGRRWAIIAAAALAPFLWSRSEELGARLSKSLSPYMARLSSIETGTGIAPVPFNVSLRMTEAARVDGRLRARPGAASSGLVNFSVMSIPVLGAPHPGVYRLSFPGLRVEPPAGQVSGHLIILSRYTVQVVSPWNSRSSYPLIGGKVRGDYSITFAVQEPAIYYVYTDFSGHGELDLDGIQGSFLPLRIEPQLTEMRHFEHHWQGRPLKAAVVFTGLDPGLYRVRFDLEGSTFARFFERLPAPIRTAAYSTGPDSGDGFKETANLWFGLKPRGWSTVNSPDYRRPLQEGIHPPWWLSIPGAGHRASQLRFVLPEPGDVGVLLHYDGPVDLQLNRVVLYRETYDRRDGPRR